MHAAGVTLMRQQPHGPAAFTMSTLRTQELTKSYGGRTVVRGVSIDVRSGEIVGLLGPNGAGKTTTFYMTVGLTAPDSGRVILDDEDVTDDPMYIRARKGIAYLPQEPSIFRGLTVEQNILAIVETLRIPRKQRRARVQELLAELKLSPLAASPAYTLSGGERRRVEITRALVISPRFILLDEPLAGMGQAEARGIIDLISSLKIGRAVLLVEHDMDAVFELADRLTVMHDGCVIASGSPQEVRMHPAVRTAYLGDHGDAA